MQTVTITTRVWLFIYIYHKIPQTETPIIKHRTLNTEHALQRVRLYNFHKRYCLVSVRGPFLERAS